MVQVIGKSTLLVYVMRVRMTTKEKSYAPISEYFPILAML